MSMWSVRVTLSDDPQSRARFAAALGGWPVRLVSITPRDSGSADVAGEAVLELTRDEDLSGLLTALHALSPQVFVSRADPSELPESGRTGLAAIPHRLPPEQRRASSSAPEGQQLSGSTLGW
jgi:hypothetical protein